MSSECATDRPGRPARPSARSAFRVASLLALLLALPPATADPLLGRWLGTMGTEQERVEVGLEFVAAADGGTRVRLTHPMLNLFDHDAGPVERSGARVTHAELFPDLTLEGERLAGRFPGPRSSAALARVRSLPREPRPPALPEGPRLRWRTRLQGLIYASPAVAEGMAYVGSSGGVLSAIDLRDGSIRWTWSGGGPIYAEALVAGDALYVVSDDGGLAKLERASGKPIWRYALGSGKPRILPHPQAFDWDWQAPKPALAEGVVYVGASDGGFHAVDAASGERRWRFDTRGAIRNAAAIDGARVFVGSTDGHVYALDRSDGREHWRHDSGGAIDAELVVHQGRVLVGNRASRLAALDAESGAVAWSTFFWGSWVESAPAVVEGTLYIGSSDLRRVSAIDPDSGRVRWRSDVHGWTWGTPLVIGDRIYVGAAGGTPYMIRHEASFSVLDRASGRLLARRPLPDGGGHQWGIAGSPRRAGDAVLVATIEGALHAYALE